MTTFKTTKQVLGRWTGHCRLPGGHLSLTHLRIFTGRGHRTARMEGNNAEVALCPAAFQYSNAEYMKEKKWKC